ncbi:G-protein coupled receptor [Paragonimus heterotremus]|uniref:G-protein coupled receptor n=1 Tax=Paragonimus heterotremus TaxID=100268 RepID=A0A8J4SVC6_9TREM|nr:G-protein coupled receptor [Paragonimus heterotremus]
MNETHPTVYSNLESNEVVDSTLLKHLLIIGSVHIPIATCVVGLILNFINVAVFVHPAFTAPAYIMMRFLSLADAITLGLRIPQGSLVYSELTGQSTDLTLYLYVYIIYVETPVTNMSESVSAWLTMALAIERYVSMKYWYLANRHFQPANVKRLVFAICMFAVIINIPFFFHQNITIYRINGVLQLNSSYTAFSASPYYATCSWLRFALVQIIPFCFLCVSNCLLLLLVTQHNQKLTQKESSKKTNQKRDHSDLKEDESYNATSCVNDLGARRNNSSNNVSSKLAASNPKVLQLQSQTVIVKNEDQIATSIDTVTLSPKQVNQRYSLSTPGITLNAPSNRHQRRRAAQTKLTILLIAIIVLFLVGQVPQSLAYLPVFTTLGICDVVSMEHCLAYKLYRMITMNLAQIAFAANFFVYLFLNRDFRATFKQMTLSAGRFIITMFTCNGSMR